METQERSHGGSVANATNNLDYSKAEELVKHINIPNSQFHGKWEKEKGYAIGYENIKITKSYSTLEEALNQIGYGVDKDLDGDEILVKVGETNFETIAMIIKAILLLNKENNG